VEHDALSPDPLEAFHRLTPEPRNRVSREVYWTPRPGQGGLPTQRPAFDARLRDRVAAGYTQQEIAQEVGVSREKRQALQILDALIERDPLPAPKG
jgi:hypothetical protein